MDDHIKQEISTYLAGALTESRNRQIEAHAASCDKCRTALNRARAKQARVKREALKKASTDKVPNLFYNRQNKNPESAPSGGNSLPYIVAGVVVLALGVAGIRYYLQRPILPDTPIPAVNSGSPTPVTKEPPPAVVETTPAETPKAVVKPPELPKVESVPTPVAPPKPVVLPAATTAQVAAPAPKPPLVLPILQNWKGANSAVTENRQVVIRKDQVWQDLMAEMQVPLDQPFVNFSDQMVLGVFIGAYPVGTSVEIVKIEERGDAMAALYRILPPAVQTSTPDVTAMSHPYFLAVVPRVERRIKLTMKESN